MDFCPVCGARGQPVQDRCRRVARYYGYSDQQIAELGRQGSSIAVPFFETRRLFFLLDLQAGDPVRRFLAEAVEAAGDGGRREEHGNFVRVLPMRRRTRPALREIFVKDDVSKTMVVYRHDDGIEHFGSEERAVLFADLAERCFGLGAHVPPVASGLSPLGTKFVVSAGLPRDRYAALGPDDGARLRQLWDAGVLPRLALMDLVLGQNDRNANNVLLTGDSDSDLEIALIDNDDAFGPYERLIDPFAYLVPLLGAAGLNFAGAAPWFARLSLPDIVAFLARMALPREIVAGICARFAFAAAAAQDAMPLAAFVAAAFSGRRPTAEPLPGRPWVEYRALVSEGPAGTRYRNFLGMRQAGREACRETSIDRLWSFEGQALGATPAEVHELVIGSPDGGPAALASCATSAFADGFSELIRRRLFVSDDQLRIVEVRADPAGWHVVVRVGKLGRYDDKKVERFISLPDAALAIARADALEQELLAAGCIDLRARLLAFKTAGVVPIWF
jgi:hypothetical protein